MDEKLPSIIELRQNIEDKWRQGQERRQRIRQFVQQTRQELPMYRQRQRTLLREIQQHEQQRLAILSPPDNGLTPDRIERFEHFTAGETLVGEQCVVCHKDLEIETQMVRLDCHINHYLCKTCTDSWFKNHATCPTCRHKF